MYKFTLPQGTQFLPFLGIGIDFSKQEKELNQIRCYELGLELISPDMTSILFDVESHATTQIDPRQPYRPWNQRTKIYISFLGEMWQINQKIITG